MTTFLNALLIILPAVFLIFSIGRIIKNRFQGKSIKKAVRFNLSVFAVMVLLSISMAFVTAAVDEKAVETAEPATAVSEEAETAKPDSSKGMGLLAAGLVTGLAGIGGGIAVAAGAPAAIAATSENPASFGKSIIFVALGESIALYGVVISILILNKI